MNTYLWPLLYSVAIFISSLCDLLASAQDIQSAPLQYISYSAIPNLPFSERLLRLRDGNTILGATRTARTESFRGYDSCPVNSECTFMSKCTALRRVQPTVRCDVALNEVQSAISMHLPGGVCCRAKTSAGKNSESFTESLPSTTLGDADYRYQTNKKSGHLVNFVQSPNPANIHYATGGKTPIVLTDPGKETSVSYIPGEAPVDKHSKAKLDLMSSELPHVVTDLPKVQNWPSSFPLTTTLPTPVTLPASPNPLMQPTEPPKFQQVLFQTAEIVPENPLFGTKPQQPVPAFVAPQSQWLAPGNQPPPYAAPMQTSQQQWPPQMPVPVPPFQNNGLQGPPIQNFFNPAVGTGANQFSMFTGGNPNQPLFMMQQNGQIVQQFPNISPVQLSQTQFQPSPNITMQPQQGMPPAVPVPTPARNPPGADSDHQQTFCGVRDNIFTMGRSPRVLGGRPSDLGAWPWMAVISSSKRLRCGATILNEQFLITAAHCVYKNYQYGYYQDLSVQIGVFSLDDYQLPQFPPETVRILRVFIHPYFNTSQSSYDLALIQLTQPIVFKPHIKPACLPSMEHVGEMGTVLGWGKRKETDDRSNLPTVLQEVNMPILYPWQCILDLRSNKIFDDVGPQFVCAGGKANQDACRGDSGGPLLALTKGQFWELVGIVSKGYGCGKENVPGIYTNIWYLKDWIEQTVASNWNSFTMFSPFFARERNDVFNNFEFFR